MSQKKVDIYKEKKANRQQIMKKEKAMLRLEQTIAGLFCAAVLVWVGYSAYGQLTKTDAPATVEETVVDVTALEDYMADLAAE